ncbi:hypothetical protein GCM10017673_45560 [Streptosporangium violaceochromogenes]|nr:hypothetical protein GCM10017673_45560 [Streptosporangium violaceochromogenes]
MLTPRPPAGRRSLLPPAGLIERLGGLVAVLTGLALCAVVQQQIDGYAAPPETWRRSTGPVVGATHPAAATSLIHRVRVVAGERWVRLVPGAVEGRAVPRPDVRLVRIDRAGNWAFGTWSVPPPPGVNVMPTSSLFIARWAGVGWQVALAGTRDFARFIRQAPVTVIPEDERSFLEQYDRAEARSGRARAGRAQRAWVAPTVRAAPGAAGSHLS